MACVHTHESLLGHRAVVEGLCGRGGGGMERLCRVLRGICGQLEGMWRMVWRTLEVSVVASPTIAQFQPEIVRHAGRVLCP